MTVKMDKFGRVLIPKDVRREQGLAPGTELEIERCEAGGVRLVPLKRYTWVEVESDGWWPLFALRDEDGNPHPGPLDFDAASEAAREELARRGEVHRS